MKGLIKKTKQQNSNKKRQKINGKTSEKDYEWAKEHKSQELEIQTTIYKKLLHEEFKMKHNLFHTSYKIHYDETGIAL